MIAKDFPGTIKVLAEAGFERVELCSPVGYADSGFAGLAKYKGTQAAQGTFWARCGRRLRGVLTSVSKRTAEESGARLGLGEGCRLVTNARAQPRRAQEPDHG